jgi:hypothetical protein
LSSLQCGYDPKGIVIPHYEGAGRKNHHEIDVFLLPLTALLRIPPSWYHNIWSGQTEMNRLSACHSGHCQSS